VALSKCQTDLAELILECDILLGADQKVLDTWHDARDKAGIWSPPPVTQESFDDTSGLGMSSHPSRPSPDHWKFETSYLDPRSPIDRGAEKMLEEARQHVVWHSAPLSPSRDPSKHLDFPTIAGSDLPHYERPADRSPQSVKPLLEGCEEPLVRHG